MDIDIKINEKMLPWLKIKRRFKVVVGGRGSGKSQGLADMALISAMQGKKVACFREFQNSIRESVYSLLKEEIDRLKLPGFTMSRDEIHHESGGMFIFKGLERNREAMKSMQGFDIAWVEEAQTISEESLQILTPTIRKEGSEIWFCGNPRSSEDAFSKRFVSRQLSRGADYDMDELHLRIKLNYTDNPWFPKSLDDERKDDYQRLPRALYDHIWLGAFNDSVDNSIIKAEWFDAAIDAHKTLNWKPSGAIVTAHDPSNSGDARAWLTRHGNVITNIDESTILDINDACEASMRKARDLRSDVYVYDADGCGLGLKRQINDYWDDSHVQVVAFQGGSKPERAEEVHEYTNGRQILISDAYINLRAQKYFEIADRFHKTFRAVHKGEYIDPSEMISISSEATQDMAAFKAELCRIPQVYNVSGKFQIMSKQHMMQKLKIKSPNMADCLMMSYIEIRKNRKRWGEGLLSPKLGVC